MTPTTCNMVELHESHESRASYAFAHRVRTMSHVRPMIHVRLHTVQWPS